MLNFHASPNLANLYRWCRSLQEDLTGEATTNYDQGKFLPWPEKINQNEKWLTTGCKWQGEPVSSDLYVLKSLVTPFDELIVNAGYSALAPGAFISPHKGYTGDVLRFHFGLVVPEGDCQLRVGDAHFHWQKGNALVFDDTILHSAWNNTARERVILLLDVRRDYL